MACCCIYPYIHTTHHPYISNGGTIHSTVKLPRVDASVTESLPHLEKGQPQPVTFLMKTAANTLSFPCAPIPTYITAIVTFEDLVTSPHKPVLIDHLHVSYISMIHAVSLAWEITNNNNNNRFYTFGATRWMSFQKSVSRACSHARVSIVSALAHRGGSIAMASTASMAARPRPPPCNAWEI